MEKNRDREKKMKLTVGARAVVQESFSFLPSFHLSSFHPPAKENNNECYKWTATLNDN